jgi:hypothetical protein
VAPRSLPKAGIGTQKRPSMRAAAMRVAPSGGDALPAMPADTVRALRRLLAEALVRDYLDDRKAVSPGDGDSSLGDANPKAQSQKERA